MKRTFSLLLLTLFVCTLSATAQYKRIVTLAGKGGIGDYSGDGYAATNAFFHGPEAVSVDKVGNVYIVDFLNFRVRKVLISTGQVVTFAGNGTPGNNGDGSSAPSAEMNPQGVAADMRGNVFISDATHSVVRKVNTLGIISTYAGTGAFGWSGDGGLAIHARLKAPSGLFTDNRSNLYICDAANHVIRKVDTFGIITTIAGNDTAGYSGDGGPATDARLDSPYAVTVDRFGDLFIADYKNNVIRMVDAATGSIATVAGTGAHGYTGDNGLAINATLDNPRGIAVDTALNVYISDANNNVIRKVDAAGTITTAVGNGYPGFGGDLGDPLGANLFNPYGIALDTFGSLYIADANNQRVRKVYNITLGVHDVSQGTTVTAFPNPVNNQINITGLSINDRVAVYDLTGRPVTDVWTATTNGAQAFAISHLAAGMYVLQVTGSDGNSKATIQIVK